MEIGDRINMQSKVHVPPIHDGTSKIPQVLQNGWVKTIENSWVARNAIAEISIEYQGRDGYDDDDWEVVILLNINDLWLPGPLPEEKIKPSDVGKFYRQINDQQRRDVFRGTMAECEDVSKQIMRG